MDIFLVREEFMLAFFSALIWVNISTYVLYDESMVLEIVASSFFLFASN